MRRRVELGLVVLAALITIAAYVLVSMGSDASVPANIGPFFAAVLALLIAAHIATRRLAPNADPLLLPLAVLLNGLGYVFIVRVANDVRGAKDLPGLQATWTLLGVGAYIATLMVLRRVRVLDRYRYIFMAIGVALLLLPLTPKLGVEVSGARIWIRAAGLSFQPGEVAKIALAIFFASYLVEHREVLRIGSFKFGPLHLPEPKHLGPVGLAWGVSLIVLVMERDLGSSLLFFAVFVTMVWIATERSAYLLIGLLLFSGGAYASYQKFDHVQTRVVAWTDPWQDPKNKGFQIIEGQFAMAEGGLTGTGLGLGKPYRVPKVETDFIFAAIGEELGLAGSTAILIAFLLIVASGLRIAVRARHPFEKLLAAGLTAMIGFQAFIIIGGVTRVVPLTGITLPFVSYGGSSLLSNYVLLALLVRISDESAGAPTRSRPRRQRRVRESEPVVIGEVAG
ncbi:MAG: FtsW/RodA/SpoVE family cell cycle protein [Acidimicrobiales bacterium]